MAKKITNGTTTTTTTTRTAVAAKAAAPAASGSTSTPVRNSAIPKIAQGKRDITHEQIAIRAYEISQGPGAGSPDENWLRAERELRGA